MKIPAPLTSPLPLVGRGKVGGIFYADKIEFNPTNGELYAIRQTDTHMYRIDNWNTATPTVVRRPPAPLLPTTFSWRTRREEFQSSAG